MKISAAQWTNVYQPRKKAERVTEDEAQKVIEGKKEAEAAELANAMEVSNCTLSIYHDYALGSNVLHHYQSGQVIAGKDGSSPNCQESRSKWTTFRWG